MSDSEIKGLFAWGIVIIGVILAFGIVIYMTNASKIPRCAEDAVIVGTGEYFSDGSWKYYSCGPSRDDL